jgi:hypothetical protein
MAALSNDVCRSGVLLVARIARVRGPGAPAWRTARIIACVRVGDNRWAFANATERGRNDDAPAPPRYPRRCDPI